MKKPMVNRIAAACVVAMMVVSACSRTEETTPIPNHQLSTAVSTGTADQAGARTSQTQAAAATTAITPLAGNPVNPQNLLNLVNAKRLTGCTCTDPRDPSKVKYMPPVPAIAWNAKLEQASLLHSQDMLAQNYFSHTSKDGRSPWQRIQATGYVYRAAGENIALGYTTEEAVVAGWYRSYGHCINMMTAYKDMGVGRAGNYWTMNLATPR